MDFGHTMQYHYSTASKCGNSEQAEWELFYLCAISKEQNFWSPIACRVTAMIPME